MLIAQGIPNLPDLTHPNELIEFGNQILKFSFRFGILIVGLGIAIAILSFALRNQEPEHTNFISEWVVRYSVLLRGLHHLILILILLFGGFFLSTTLSNRYHHWEQAKVTKIAESVAGDRLEQSAPQIRYTIEEPYTYDTQVEGKIVRVKATRKVDRFLTLSASQINVNLNQTIDPATERAIYQVNFTADYQVVNNLDETQDFFFAVQPPFGYKLLQNLKVERDGTRLVPVNPGNYDFPLRLTAGETTKFKVTYQALGGPRWIYNANGQLLSNFSLTVFADFPNADFASGIIPTESKVEGRGTRFTWKFDDNVSVLNPFGVFTSVGPIKNTGILPRLLLLVPGLFLWWLGLLYLSMPMTLKDVAIAAGIFFACILSLTYLSRAIDPKLAWSSISLILLIMVWGLGNTKQARFAAIIATIAGGILPVFGLLVPYSGITLSLAALLSVIWLAIRHWYRLFVTLEH
ncbi:hypothetical protein BCD67_02090 [Oscillatoriales cyanobacterium USR001]|nr:hypothetical protein BCD67_02090 [Oscillatoriales cyanobacterium USR001]